MIDARSTPYNGLALLGRAFRERSSGTLSLGPASLRLVLRDGHIVAIVFPDEAPAPPPPPSPDDSAQMRLERVLSEIGIRPAAARSLRRTQRNLRERMIAGLLDTGGAAAFEPGGRPSDAVEVAGATEALILEAIRRVPDPLEVRHGLGDLDQRLVPTVGLAEERTLTLNEGYILSHADGTSTAREVLQQVPLEPEETERTLLGLLLTGRLEYRPVPAAVRPLVAAPAAERAPDAQAPHSAALSAAATRPATVPSAEDGSAAAAAETPQPAGATSSESRRPVDAGDRAEAEGAGVADRRETRETDEPERAAGSQPGAAAGTADTAPPGAAVTDEAAAPAAELPSTAAAAERPAAPAPPEPVAAAPREQPAEVPPEPPAEAPEPARPEIDPAALERRREVLEFFQSLPSKNHFEVLGVEPGCTDPEVKRAYAGLARKYHPDTQRRPGLEDLHDVFEAIFIRVGEAWEVLGDARSRASYEARFPPRVRHRPGAGAGAAPGPPVGPPVGPRVGPPPPAEPDEPYIPTDETLTQAHFLLQQARYWDAIQMLEQRLPHMPPSKQRHRGRILLARAYAKNPNWLRKAEDALQQVVREDPANADAHYELGLLYKSGGMLARAQASFRRAIELRPEHREAAAELGLAPDARPPSGLLKRLFGRGRAS